MNSKSVLIIEDELLIAKTFEKYLKSKGYLCFLAIHFDDALVYLKKENIDVVLIDINLRKSINGIEIANYINLNYKIPFVFVTSNIESETILKAKKTNPKGYITKPVNKDTLFTTLEMIDLNKNSEVLQFKDGRELYKISYDSILYFQASHVYVKIYVADRKHPFLIRNSLQNIAELLNSNCFIQSHRSFIVNINHVISSTFNELNIKEHIIPISKSRRDIVLLRMNEILNLN